jgi:SEC-C motif
MCLPRAIADAIALTAHIMNRIDSRRPVKRVTSARGKRTGKIGRNDPCPCGSGLKFKKCCLTKMMEKPNGTHQPPPGVLEKARRIFEQKAHEERERVAQYGEVRPPITLKAFDKRLVAVGSTIYGDAQWKYFPDFLRDYVPEVFGAEWVNSENAAPEEERHLVTQWRIESVQYMNSQPLQPDGSRRALPSGAMAALMAFSYDLYVVADNGGLDDALLHRLKDREHFQGARHELFAEATCLRAGFSVEHENEKDGTRRHAEFIAKHKATGQLLSVEAKSKHRAGVLAVPGDRESQDRPSLRFGPLINDAVRKNPLHPLVIFLDTNLHSRAADRLYSREPDDSPSRLMNSLLERVTREHGGKDPYSMIVFTNHPHHYAAEDQLDPQKHLACVVPLAPPGAVNQHALKSLYQAASIYGNIPNEFPVNN